MKIVNCKLKISDSGFTLIEFMVTMAIICILAAVAVVNFARNEDRDVRQEKERLTTFVREIQNRALSGDREDIPMNPGFPRVCGFGFRLASSNSFQMFYVSAPSLNTICQTYIESGTWQTDANNYHEYGAVFSLNNSVTVSSGITTTEKIFFLGPSGRVYRDNSQLGTTPIQIYLTKTGLGGSILFVTIDETGNIY